MLELLSVQKKVGIQRWNGVIPPADANTLIRMHTFNTISDIVDKGPNNISVTRNGNVSVGSNSIGSYVNFPGSGSWVNFSSSLLNGNSYDMTFIIDNPTYTGGPLIDSRPTQTNGQYVVFGFGENSPFTTSLYYNSTLYSNSSSVSASSFPVVLVYKVRPSVITCYAGDTLIATWTGNFNFVNNAPFKIARNAYSNAVPDAIFKMYYFDIKKVN